MKHRDIEERISSYLLGELAEPEAAVVRSHLDDCEGCRALAQELERTLDLMRDALAADAVTPQALSPDRKAAVLGEGPVAAHASSDTAPWIQPWMWKAVGLAATVVVLAGLIVPTLQSGGPRSRRYTTSTLGGQATDLALAATSDMEDRMAVDGEQVAEKREAQANQRVRYRGLSAPASAAVPPATAVSGPVAEAASSASARFGSHTSWRERERAAHGSSGVVADEEADGRKLEEYDNGVATSSGGTAKALNTAGAWYDSQATTWAVPDDASGGEVFFDQETGSQAGQPVGGIASATRADYAVAEMPMPAAKPKPEPAAFARRPVLAPSRPTSEVLGRAEAEAGRTSRGRRGGVAGGSTGDDLLSMSDNGGGSVQRFEDYDAAGVIVEYYGARNEPGLDVRVSGQASAEPAGRELGAERIREGLDVTKGQMQRQSVSLGKPLPSLKEAEVAENAGAVVNGTVSMDEYGDGVMWDMLNAGDNAVQGLTEPASARIAPVAIQQAATPQGRAPVDFVDRLERRDGDREAKAVRATSGLVLGLEPLPTAWQVTDSDFAFEDRRGGDRRTKDLAEDLSAMHDTASVQHGTEGPLGDLMVLEQTTADRPIAVATGGTLRGPKENGVQKFAPPAEAVIEAEPMDSLAAIVTNPVYPESAETDEATRRWKTVADLEPASSEAAGGFVSRDHGLNPFVVAAENPVSTFAIDVDTAAYTLTRKHLLAGTLPPAEAVRTEEFVNYFDYEYRPPRRSAFAVYTDLADTPFGDGSLLRIGVKGKRLGRDEQRPAVLTFVVDTSGSMDTPDRLGLVRQSLDLLLDGLGPLDRVAIVQVNSQARLILPHTPAGERDAIEAAVSSMQCSGSTHLEGGIRLGYEVAAGGFQGGAVNRVLLLSDGAANLGSADPEAILALVETYRVQGIYCSVFGFGVGTYNDAMLEQLANQGDGVYRFVDSRAESERLFVDELAATLQIIASDVKIQVEFDADRVRTYRQIGYENRQLTKEQFRDDQVDAGEVGSGESVTALYEILPAALDGEPIGTVRIRYRDVGAGEIRESAHPIRVRAPGRRFEETEPRFRLATAAAAFAEILRGSPYAEAYDCDDVATVLRPVALELHLDGRVRELLHLVRVAGDLIQ